MSGLMKVYFKSTSRQRGPGASAPFFAKRNMTITNHHMISMSDVVSCIIICDCGLGASEKVSSETTAGKHQVKISFLDFHGPIWDCSVKNAIPRWSKIK